MDLNVLFVDMLLTKKKVIKKEILVIKLVIKLFVKLVIKKEIVLWIKNLRL